MRTLSTLAAAVMMLAGAYQSASAQAYQSVSPSDPQYIQCLAFANSRYQGGMAPSPIAGQTKMEAFCTCMWQETPDDFRGNLVVFSESAKGQQTNKICEKYSNWE